MSALSSFSQVGDRKSVGHLLGHRYRIEAFLGEGGTATVHLARDLETSRPVVIKRMKPEVATQDELRRRFVLEAKALSKIEHPYVVRSLGVEEPESEAPFLVLEALKGETLGDLLRRKERVSVSVTLRLIRQAAEALEAVHDKGVVHRDIKPDNLFLVEKPGGPCEIRVLDFGMAHFGDESLEGGTSILGTAQYMAPEQILVEAVDARTDVYGLGVVMFRMLTGHLPFDAQSKKDLLRHQLFSPVPPVTWLNEELPADVAEIVRIATRKSPDGRHRDMRALISHIDSVSTALGSEAPSVEVTTTRESGIQNAGQDFEWTHYETDIYSPTTSRGREASAILAQEFGVYHRPHSPAPPIAL